MKRNTFLFGVSNLRQLELFVLQNICSNKTINDVAIIYLNVIIIWGS